MAADKDNTLILGLAAMALAYFAILKPITDKLGLTESEKDRRDAEAGIEAQKNEGWNPSFYKLKPPYAHRLYTPAAAKAQAGIIYNAWGKVNDDEQAIYAVFRRLISRAQLSQVVDAYATYYHQDLLTRIKNPWYILDDGFDTDELKEIYTIVNKLPKYFKA
jgi:hypothetical protein